MAVDIRLATFYEKNIEVFTDNEIKYVALNSICKNIGLSWGTQYKKLMKDPTLNKAVKKKYNIVEGKRREIICIPLDMLQGWLFHINENKVKPEIKEIVMLYKKECYEVLDNYFNQGYALNEEMLIENPDLQQKLSEEVQELQKLKPYDILYDENSEPYTYIGETVGGKVLLHHNPTKFYYLLDEPEGSVKTFKGKIAKEFKKGNPLRFEQGMEGVKGQKLLVRNEALLDILKKYPQYQLCSEKAQKLQSAVLELVERSEGIYISGVAGSLEQKRDPILNEYIVNHEATAYNSEAILNSRNVVYVLKLENGYFYIGSAVDQTLVQRFKNHKVIKEKQLQEVYLLFVLKKQKNRVSTNAAVLEAELQTIIANLTNSTYTAISNSGEFGFKASSSDIFRAFFECKHLDAFDLVDKESCSTISRFLNKQQKESEAVLD